MPLEIRLDSNFELTTNNNNQLLLPVIDLVPIANSFGNPHILNIKINVTGNPLEIVSKIQTSYPLFQRVNNPYYLASLQRFSNNPCQLDQPLNSEVNCTLQVTIDYVESRENNQPDPTTPKTVIKSCNLQAKIQTISQPIENTQKMIEYPGWVAIDFGTCNTTVTLFDPKQVSQDLILPEEQQKSLENKLTEWLNSSVSETFLTVSSGEWQQFINELRQNLNITDYINITSDNLLTILREIELILNHRSEEFRALANQQLNHIYTEVFNVPTLSRQQLKPVILDSIRKQPEIISESEVTNLEPLTLLMGERAKQNRNNALSQNPNNYSEVISRFYHSIKRYMGSNKTFDIYVNNTHKKVHIDQLIQTAYERLLELIQSYRDQHKEILAEPEGKLNKIIVTYPTVAPPIVRKEIEKCLHNLGITQVQTAYDEAVAVAIFYMWQQFGGNINIGIEAFKTRAKYNGSQWWQNVLVLDIGGGTTDIALINLTLEEINVFQPYEDRGLGGRYYKLTPKILGASGHPQLGGELITLRLFRYLKVAIADCVLTSVQNGNLTSDDLQKVIEGLEEQFQDQGKFVSGSLINKYQLEYPRKDEIKNDILNTTEKVIHTRWMDQEKSVYLQPFYTLWDYAEDVKLDLSKNQHNVYSISEQQISLLLQQSGINFTVQNADSLQVFISKEQFDRIVKSVIDEAIDIGKGLMETRLNETNFSDKDKTVDWLILSGKTCNFPQVLDQIYQKFSASKHFIWNPERITFMPEFTKLATSVGACYAEKLRQFIYTPEQAKESLKKGQYQLDINVENLFYYLPCSFELQGQEGMTNIFKVGTKLSQINSQDEMVKTRSDWKGTQLKALIFRLDYQKGTPRYWGTFNGESLAKQLELNETEFREKIKVQFEINQKLDIDLLFCRGKNPHYKIDTSSSSLQVNPDVIKEQNWQIAINVLESQTMDSNQVKIIFHSQQEKQTFRHFASDGKWQKNNEGWINILGGTPQNGKYSFFLISPQIDEGKPNFIGELPQPKRNSDSPCEYYASLDEDGLIRVHIGEVPYITSDNYKCLETEGLVYRVPLQLERQDIDMKRDPFCGQH